MGNAIKSCSGILLHRTCVRMEMNRGFIYTTLIHIVALPDLQQKIVLFCPSSLPLFISESASVFLGYA